MYAKVFSSLWDGSMRGQSDKQLVFIYLLAHSDADGVAEIIQGKIADDTGLGTSAVCSALAELMAPDPMSRTDGADGRRLEPLDGRGWGWTIVNYQHYRGLRDDETRRQQTREAVRRFRDKKADVSHGKPQKAQGEEEEEAEGEEEKEESKAQVQEIVKPGSVSSLFGSVSTPIRKFHSSKQEQAEIWKLVEAEPEEVQRTCMAIVGRLAKSGESAGTARTCIEHYLAHRLTIMSPFAYYAPDGEGLAWVKQKSRLASQDREWAAEKKAAAEAAS
jgi:hypothetical protein